MVRIIWKRNMWYQTPSHDGTNWAPKPMRITRHGHQNGNVVLTPSRLFSRNGGKYIYDGMTHQFQTGLTLLQVWFEKGLNASSQRDNLNLYACFQIYLC